MQVLADGVVVAAGGASDFYYGFSDPFVARLLGNSAGGGPGVADFVVDDHLVREADGSVSLIVRRIGGRTGAVSVDYAAGPITGFPAEFTATVGADFGPAAGTLTWVSGDDSERVITVPVPQDSATPERPEQFAVRLAVPDAGAGLATHTARVTIQGDATSGLFSLSVPSSLEERHGPVHVIVQRLDYSAGAVSVELLVGGTAANGQDYSLPGQTLRLTWADGDSNPNVVSIPLIDDKHNEGEETITLSLSGATGGALIGPQSSATVRIVDDDPSITAGGGGSGGGSGGGGRSGGLFLMLSGLAGLLRRRTRASR
jgi:hypothetical protein